MGGRWRVIENVLGDRGVRDNIKMNSVSLSDDFQLSTSRDPTQLW